MTDREIIQKLFELGHFANPSLPNTHNVTASDLDKLRVGDEVVRQAVLSYQDLLSDQLDRFSYQHHGRIARVDGDLGPATRDLLEVQRCAVPDYDPNLAEQVGSGNWARCHGVGNFHKALVWVNRSTTPSFLQPVFDRVWANVVASYRELGLLWEITEDQGAANTSLTWVNPDGGWIGLAIVGRNQKCGSQIWSRYDRNYKGGSSEASITTQWTTLIKHELGHNTGLGHSRGGVMNPSIVNGLPVSWKGDPSEPQLKQWFGGEPVPGGPTEPNPPVPPIPPVPPASGRPAISLSITVPPGASGTFDYIAVPRPSV